MISVLLGALLFLSAAPIHGMGLIMAVKKMVKKKPHAQLVGGAGVQACAQNAFAQTGLPAALLALILDYCSEIKLGIITLPDAKKKNASFKYPKHSAVQVSLDGNILTVLTTGNRLLYYQLPEGVLIAEKPAGLSPEGIYLFENREWLVVNGRTRKSKVGSVYVSDSIVCPNASNEGYLARIVGDLSELKVYFSSMTLSGRIRFSSVDEICVSKKRYGVGGLCTISTPEESLPVHGHCYYDNRKLPLRGEQPCTTIEVSLQRSAVADMLNIPLGEEKNRKEDSEESKS